MILDHVGGAGGGIMAVSEFLGLQCILETGVWSTLFPFLSLSSLRLVSILSPPFQGLLTSTMTFLSLPSLSS